jgi:hypothetical protein
MFHFVPISHLLCFFTEAFSHQGSILTKEAGREEDDESFTWLTYRQ